MATYESEMLSFGYVASLHIEHPRVSPQAITQRLGRDARSTHNAGGQRKTPNGTSLDGTYPTNYWSCDLETEDQQDLTEFLERIVTELRPNRGFLRGIAETGGELVVFIGVASSKCCAHQFDRQLLSDLADTGLALRIDLYGGKLSQRGLHPGIGKTA